MQHLRKSIGILYLSLLSFSAVAQMPTHIDPGQGDDSISLQEHPEYIILIVILILAMILFYYRFKTRDK